MQSECSVPTMYDRAVQAVVKAIVEPEWEAKFEPNSYGFRPGRSAHDAIKQIKLCIQTKAKYVLDADIMKCFDRINHEVLLKRLGLKGKVRQQVKAWLKSGVIEQEALTATSEGTPQGGVISPLLANIALHGIEYAIAKEFPASKKGYLYGSARLYGRVDVSAPVVVRYADDFVVLCDEKRIVERCREIISEWLKEVGLELKPEKTRLTHTFNEELSEDGVAGFDFLGHHIQQYPAGKYRANLNTHEKSLGFNTIITPTKKKSKEHQEHVKRIIIRHRSKTPQESLIKDLNPVIRGWTQYYRNSDVQNVGELSRQDYLTYLKLRRWAKRRCGSASAGFKKYWTAIGGRNWVFAAKKGSANTFRLFEHSSIECSSKDYVKVKGDKSPYDGDLVYWSTRMGRHPELSSRKAGLLKKQKGKCCLCGLYFRDEDVMEVDHKIAIALSGRDEWTNLQLLHRHCHHEKTREDKKKIKEKNAEKEMTDYLEKVLGKRSIVWRDGKPYAKGEVYKVLNKLNLNWGKVEVEVVDGLVRIDGLMGRKFQ